jgi:hypothetical protein
MAKLELSLVDTAARVDQRGGTDLIYVGFSISSSASRFSTRPWISSPTASPTWYHAARRTRSAGQVFF